MNLKKHFGRNLKYYRFQNNFTQEQLATKSNISVNYLISLERGEYSPNFELIETLSKNLGIEVYQLFLEPKDITLPRRIDMINTDEK